MAKKIFFLGAGNMAEGIIGGLIASGAFPAENISAGDISPARLHYMQGKHGINISEDNARSAADCDIFVLAVRPQDMDDLGWVKDALGNARPLIISIVSSFTIEKLEKICGKRQSIARLMPNTLIKSMRGYSALCVNENCGEEQKALLEAVAGGIGRHMYVEEGLFNAWTGFSTSGPLMIYKFIYGMIEGGVYSGFSPEQSRKIVVENIIGAGLTLSESDEHPLQIVDRMATPAGVGIEQFKTLEDGGFTALCMEAVRAAVQKAEKMGRKKE